MQHAYTSFNKTIAAQWEAIAPGVPVVFGHPVAANGDDATLPSECLRVYWLNEGGSAGPANQEEATIQLDIFVPNGNVALARGRAAALNRALGFNAGVGVGRMYRFDWTQTPEAYLSDMTIEPFEDGWVTVPDPQPRLVHLARTVFLTYEV